MPYIGQAPTQVAFVTDTFSGNGSTTAFTMSVAPANTAAVLVAVSGVLQNPSTYSVSGLTLTFSAAPPTGTGNISCRYLGIPASGVTTTAYRTVTEFTATAGQTTFTLPSYTAGFINVYRNGVLLGSADYTATNGTTVVLATGATSGDLVTVESFLVSSVLNAIPATTGSVGTTYLANNSVTAAKMAASGAWGPTGTVLQVVNATYATETSSATNTQIATGLTASITPQFSTSKILITVMLNGVCHTTNNTSVTSYLTKNGGNLKIMSYIAAANDANSGNNTTDVGTVGITYLDSPATTSSTTYACTFASQQGNATVYVQRYGSTSSVTLMEIAG